MLAYVAAALVLASRAPLVASVAGLMVFGILHNVLELRYVLRRWAGVFTGRWGIAVLGVVTLIALGRLAGAAPAVRRSEVVLGMAVLALGVLRGARARPVLAVAGLPAIAAATAMAWTHLDLYFVAVTYLHNLVPFLVLWDWSARALRGRARAAFRSVQAAWLVVVPALLLTGLLPVPSVASQARAVPFAGPVAAHVATTAPPAWRGPEAARFLALFAFLQVLHYVFWCWFLPRRAVERGSRRPASGRAVAGWVAAGALAVVFAVAYVAEWRMTKMAYTSLASYHAYVEYAVLAAVVFRPAREEPA